LQIYNTGNTHKVTVTVPASLAADYPLQLPAANPATSGLVLSSTTAGVTSWAQGYTNGGNSWAGPGTLGTNDNNTLAFKTNNATAMTIDTSGKVGIGTTSPAAPIDIERPIGGIISSSGTAVTGTGTTFTKVFNVGDTISAWGQTQTVASITIDTTLTTTAAFNPVIAGVQYQRVGAIFYSGNVGIGTTSPGADLDVASSAFGGTSIRAKNSSNNTSAFASVGAVNDVGNSVGMSMSGSNLWIHPNQANIASSTGMIFNTDAGVFSGGSDTFTFVVGGYGASSAMTIGTNSVSIGPNLNLNQSYFNGVTWLTDTWNVQQTLGGGSNPTSTLSFAHTGSSGGTYYSFPSGNVGIGTTTPAGNLAVDNASHNATICLNGTCSTTLGGGGGAQSSASNFVLNSNSDGTGTDGGFDFQEHGASIFKVSDSGGITTYGNITGNSALAVAAGGTNQNLALLSSGTGAVNVGTGNGTGFSILDPGGASANYVTVKGAASGSAPVIGTAGSDTNINLLLSPKGPGSVGIGTTNPNAPLHVNRPLLGSISSTGTTVTGSGTTFTKSFSVGDTIFADWAYSQSQTILAIASDTSMTTTAAFNPALSGSSYQRFGAIFNSGFVGIGTTAPNSLLHVGNGGASNNGTPSFLISNVGNGGMDIKDSSAGTEGEFWVWNSNVDIGSYSNNTLRFLINDTPQMFLRTDGSLQVSPIQNMSGNWPTQVGTTVTNTGANWTSAMVGMVFQLGDDGPMEIITAVSGPNSLTTNTSYSAGPDWYSIRAAGLNVIGNGNVGIGTITPNEKLNVNSGNISATSGQIYSAAQSSSVASPLTFDANSGNTMVWTTNTASPIINLNNMKSGGSYTLVIAGTGTGSATINCFSDGGTTSLPSSFVPANGTRVAGTLNKSVYTLLSDGTNCLVTWITGF
jgi:hypothetical protein